MSSASPATSALIGLFRSLHDHVIDNSVAVTWWNFPNIVLALAPLPAITYLAQTPNTRPYRMAMAVLGISLLIKVFLSYRFVDIRWAFFNVVHSVGTMHLLVKYLEYGLLERTIVDPRVKAGKRSKLFAALDLTMNSRMLGMGATTLDAPKKGDATARPTLSTPATPTTANDPKGPDGGVKVDGQTIPPTSSRSLKNRTPETRITAVLRHARIATVSYITLDTLLVLLARFGSSTIALPGGRADALATFLDGTDFVFLPRLDSPLAVPRFAVEVITITSVGIAVYVGLQMAYHLLAVAFVGSGIWEVESFEVDFMDSPWKADSLLDLWGRRWHQLFRHHFLMVSTLILRAIHLPLRPVFTLPLVFLLSGGMHGAMVIGMHPMPDPFALASFFFFSGIGSALEATFRQVTGKRVRGPWGRVWTWIFAFYTGRALAREALDSGLGATVFLPEGRLRPGLVVVDLLTRWVFDLKR